MIADADSPLEAALRADGFAALADDTNFARRNHAWQLTQLLAAVNAGGGQ